MTTMAKVEANRRNGQLSTGPQTAEGKAVVARNATTHGIFAAVPVSPGEDPAARESHRAGVVASLVLVGLFEVNLVERAALLSFGNRGRGHSSPGNVTRAEYERTRSQSRR